MSTHPFIHPLSYPPTLWRVPWGVTEVWTQRKCKLHNQTPTKNRTGDLFALRESCNSASPSSFPLHISWNEAVCALRSWISTWCNHVVSGCCGCNWLSLELVYISPAHQKDLHRMSTMMQYHNWSYLKITGETAVGIHSFIHCGCELGEVAVCLCCADGLSGCVLLRRRRWLCYFSPLASGRFRAKHKVLSPNEVV